MGRNSRSLAVAALLVPSARAFSLAGTSKVGPQRHQHQHQQLSRHRTRASTSTNAGWWRPTRMTAEGVAVADDGPTVKLSNDCLPEETLERSKVGNKFEKIKCAKAGDMMFTEVHEFAEAIRSGKYTWEDLNIDDADVRLKWVGLFHRRKRNPGTFMMRVKIPNGIMTSEQLRYVADSVAKYDPSVGVLDITTRMALQLRGLPLEDTPAIIDKLYDLGLTSLMTGLDNVRNMVGSPIAGIDPQEMVDTRQLCFDVNDMITNNRKGNAELTNLPRKINIAISGGRDDYAHTMINDVGLQPHKHPETGEIGFNVVVGGFFSVMRIAESIPLDMWIKQSDTVKFCQGLLLAFRDLGSRGAKRNQTRLMFMIEEMGMEKFRETVVDYVKRLDASFEPEPAAPVPEEAYARRDIVGVHAQKQEGKSWVCVTTPAGRLTAQDAHMAADVADAFSAGEIRLTVDQKLLFPNVDTEKVEEMTKMPLFEKFPVEQKPSISSGVVSCTGSQFCGLGLVETKNRAVDFAGKLDKMLDFPEGTKPPRIHWTGCPNSCGQAQVGDIGLMGGPARVDKKAVEGVNIFLGGGIGETHGLGEISMKGIPAAEESLLPVLRDICIEKFGAVLKE
ncbi:unnamed protein product [Pylaiella littoralis]